MLDEDRSLLSRDAKQPTVATVSRRSLSIAIGAIIRSRRTIIGVIVSSLLVYGVRWFRWSMDQNKCTIALSVNVPKHSANPFTYDSNNDTFSARRHSSQAPKIIWSFWGQVRKLCSISAPCQAPCVVEKTPLPSLVQLSIISWKRLNPDYDVRMLDDETVWNYLDRSELPAAYECLDVVHASDVIRLALLVKYGGVWLDADAIALKPLANILGDIRHPATYFTGSCTSIHVGSRSFCYIENSFLADIPQGMLLPAVRDCVWNFYESEGYVQPLFVLDNPRPWCTQTWIERGLGKPGQYFSAQQLAAFKNHGNMGSYLEMHACFVKVLDEREDIHQWWNSSAVVGQFDRLHALQARLGSDPDRYGPPLLQTVDTDLATYLLKEAWILKFTCLTSFDVGLHHLLCHESTLTTVLSDVGVIVPADCANRSTRQDQVHE